MMAEGQGNGNDAPERDSAWPSAPGAGEPPGGGAPDADTDPGTGAAPPPGQSWFPFPMTSPPGEPGQPAPSAQAGPGTPAPSSPWQAPPGGQPPWALGTPQQPSMPPSTQPGQPGPGAQPQQGTPPEYGTPPPYTAQQGTQPGYGTPGVGAPAPPPDGGQPPYGGQPQASWHPHPGEPGPVPPLPAEVSGAVPPGGGQWVPPGGGYGQQPAPPSRGRLSYALVYVLVAVLAAAVGAGAVLALRGSGGAAPAAPAAQQDIPQPRANPGSGTSGSGINTSAVASKVTPGLVDINSFVHLQQQVFEGTGMVLSPDGLVLTNNHVIKGSTRVVVQLVANGHKYTAQVVGTDNAHDVALLRLSGAAGLKTVQVGDSNNVKLGDPVVALGNAGGTGGTPTVTSGVITALHKSITASDTGSRTSENLTNMFQSNASIAEGDSGGALANAAGQVIAMNTAANSQNIGGSGTAQGFSIPIDRALSIARQIAAGHGSSTIQIGQPPFLGIAIASTSNSQTSNATNPRQQLRQFQAIAQAGFGAVDSSGKCLPNANVNPVPDTIAPAKSGALIGAVFCHEPAAAAGAQAGDVITAVNGRTVTSAASLHQVIHGYRPGQTVSLTVVDVNGQQRNLSFKLGVGPAA